MEGEGGDDERMKSAELVAAICFLQGEIEIVVRIYSFWFWIDR